MRTRSRLDVLRALFASLALVSLPAACSGSSDAGAAGSSGSSGSSGGGDDGPDGGDDGGAGGDDSGGGGPDAPAGSIDPALGGSSKGTGGASPVNGTTTTAKTVTYRLIVPSSYVAGTASPLLVVFSGTEGGATMTSNLVNLGPSTQTDGFIRAVLDGVTYNGNGAAGATVLDDVRAKYDVDNDRTYLIGESAGTTAALALGFHLRQTYFAAYWANDVNATDTPAKNAAALGFAPWGQAGPGGDLPDATAIVTAMKSAGYRVPTPAPYDGPGSTQHGNPSQLIAALTWLPGKTRK